MKMNVKKIGKGNKEGIQEMLKHDAVYNLLMRVGQDVASDAAAMASAYDSGMDYEVQERRGGNRNRARVWVGTNADGGLNIEAREGFLTKAASKKRG